MTRRLVTLIAFFASCVSIADEAPTMSKETAIALDALGARIDRVENALLRLRSLGIDKRDIEPANLGYASRSFSECESLAKSTFYVGDELAIALAACYVRHPPGRSSDWRVQASVDCSATSLRIRSAAWPVPDPCPLARNVQRFEWSRDRGLSHPARAAATVFRRRE